jgi:hypothetical protein
MGLSFFCASENSSALADVVYSVLTPVDLRWVLLVSDGDLVTIDLDASIAFFDGSLESS